MHVSEWQELVLEALQDIEEEWGLDSFAWIQLGELGKRAAVRDNMPIPTLSASLDVISDVVDRIVDGRSSFVRRIRPNLPTTTLSRDEASNVEWELAVTLALADIAEERGLNDDDWIQLGVFGSHTYIQSCTRPEPKLLASLQELDGLIEIKSEGSTWFVRPEQLEIDVDAEWRREVIEAIELVQEYEPIAPREWISLNCWASI
jgi:hypothetical protein